MFGTICYTNFKDFGAIGRTQVDREDEIICPTQVGVMQNSFTQIVVAFVVVALLVMVEVVELVSS